MDGRETIQVQIGQLRQRLLDILQEQEDRGRQFNSSQQPPEDLAVYRKKLATHAYNVLVAGITNRGKSSFVNALIGDDLLPTGKRPTTSQVFRIRKANKKEYRLRFKDGTFQEISYEELRMYGTQSAQNAPGHGRIHSDKPLRWIEVDLPVTFLPADVSLLDTPGLFAAGYRAHTEITELYLPEADAVIFVLDSTSPMKDDDRIFLEAILEKTPHIFFIQTKIGEYKDQHWQELQYDHQKTLDKLSKGRLADVRVWPISNKFLLMSAQAAQRKEDDEMRRLLEWSRFQELKQELEIFLFRVSGWQDCNAALFFADRYYEDSRAFLTRQIQALKIQSQQERVQKREQSAQDRQQFEHEWGPSGEKRLNLMNQAHQIAHKYKKQITEQLQSNGTLDKTQRKEIDTLPSMEAARKLGEILETQIYSNAIDQWRILTEQAYSNCVKLFVNLGQATDDRLGTPEDPSSDLVGSPVELSDDLGDKVKAAQEGLLNASQHTLLLTTIAALHIVPLPALAGPAIAQILAAVHGWHEAGKKNFQENRQLLRDHLIECIKIINQHFMQPAPLYDGKSLMDYQFHDLLNKVEQLVEKIVSERLQDMQQDIVRQQELTQQQEQQRVTALHICEQQLAAWDECGRVVRTINEELKELKALIEKLGTLDAS